MLSQENSSQISETQVVIERDPVRAADEIEAARRWFAARMKRVFAIGLFSELEDITPERADLLLSKNPSNRNISASAVKVLVGALKRGEWSINGETIIVSETGELNDGQHRLSAVAEAGIPISVVMVWGAKRESRKTVDMGIKRTPGHVLAMDGHQEGKNLAAAARCLANLLGSVSLNSSRTTAEIQEIVQSHPALLGSYNIGLKAGSTFRQPRGLFMALHYLMAQRDRALADSFFEALADGIGISASNDPLFQLRRRLTKNLADKAKLPPTEIAALVIKAWNATRAGEQVQSLRWSAGANEEFPQVK